MPTSSVPQLLALAALAVGGSLAGCTSDSGGDAPGEARGGSESLAAVASIDFVSKALAGAGSASLLATAPDADELAVPYDLDWPLSRLDTIAALASDSTTAAASPDAYPDAAAELAPACERNPALHCAVDLVDGDGNRAESVVVHWSGDGIVDFTVIDRAPDGTANGIGAARCDDGYQLIHGGHAVDRFDVAICMTANGDVQYAGHERGTGRGIVLDGCQNAPGHWTARNGDHRYILEPAAVNGARLQVIDPDGDTILDTPLTTVDVAAPAEARSC